MILNTYTYNKFPTVQITIQGYIDEIDNYNRILLRITNEQKDRLLNYLNPLHQIIQGKIPIFENIIKIKNQTNIMPSEDRIKLKVIVKPWAWVDIDNESVRTGISFTAHEVI